MDFGLAKRIEPDPEDGSATLTIGGGGITQRGSFIGRPDYMSPGQIRGEVLYSASHRHSANGHW